MSGHNSSTVLLFLLSTPVHFKGRSTCLLSSALGSVHQVLVPQEANIASSFTVPNSPVLSLSLV